MENFGARPSPIKEVCLQEVRESNTYVGLFGMRYGSIDEETGKSFTELEYREARALGLDIRVYLPHRDLGIPAKFIEEGDGALALTHLKEELRSRHTPDYFMEPEHLAERVCSALFPTKLRGDPRDADAPHVPPAVPASQIEVAPVPGADAETWYAVQPSRADVEPGTWLHCVCRVTNTGASTASIVSVSMALQQAAGPRVEMRLLPPAADVSFRRADGGWVTVGLSQVRPGAVRVEQEGQVIPVQPGMPVVLEMVGKAAAELAQGLAPVGVTVVCTDHVGHEVVWSAVARHL